MSLIPGNDIVLLELVIKNLQDLLAARTVSPDTSHELVQVDGYTRLHEMLVEIRTAIMALASGNVQCKVIREK
jgi:hypothetical protein